MVSSSFPILPLVSKVYHFEHFPLKSPVVIEIAGLRLLILFIRMSRESQKDWNCSRFWPGDLSKHVRKHRLFFTGISVTKHYLRLDISSLRIINIVLSIVLFSSFNRLLKSLLLSVIIDYLSALINNHLKRSQ